MENLKSPSVILFLWFLHIVEHFRDMFQFIELQQIFVQVYFSVSYAQFNSIIFFLNCNN